MNYLASLKCNKIFFIAQNIDKYISILYKNYSRNIKIFYQFLKFRVWFMSKLFDFTELECISPFVFIVFILNYNCTSVFSILWNSSYGWIISIIHDRIKTYFILYIMISKYSPTLEKKSFKFNVTFTSYSF